MKHNTLLYIAFLSSILLTACKDTNDLSGLSEDALTENIIHIGGVNTDELITNASITRADINETTDDAENITWLREPLFAGLDITYGKSPKSDTENNKERVAQLKLLADNTQTDGIKRSDENLAEYSFCYRDNSTGDITTYPALWYGNGPHYFEGLYVPEKIKYTGVDASAVYGANGSAANLTSDQHDDTSTGAIGNYILLSHYLGMPSNYTVSATVARIKLPFSHRLARVLAYILIDPDMVDVKISGYKKDANGNSVETEDPTTSKIRFCNVSVLAGVKDEESAQHHTYTPQWMKIRKAIPHFVGERGSYNDRTNTVVNAESFIAYYDVNEKTYTYPDDSDWSTLNGYNYDETTKLSSDGNYKKVSFGLVPVYDMIVRPTYTSLANVMYDEEGVSNSQTKQDLYAATNQIDFDITLDNGLQYTKNFVFDLNANYQTVVYLHISKERIDYNSSGSELWVETRKQDDYYGVNNQNSNTLSMAGSGWQRAYTNVDGDINSNTGTKISNDNLKITDGHYYKHDSEDEYAQYVTDAKWIEMFAQAHKGGTHHGDYFILQKDISIDASLLPENFVFTGHLDGHGHTITLTNCSYTKTTKEAYDEYVDWTEGGGTKYIHGEGQSYVEATGTYYATNSDTEPIVDLNAYNNATAYTREQTGVSYTYTKIEKSAVVIGTTYYKDNLGSESVEFNSEEEKNNYQGEIYRKDEVINYTYTAITFYKKVHHDAETQVVTVSSLFSGLNGKYSTAQEDAETNNQDIKSVVWEANVHKETRNGNPYWVPYKTNTDGWRAEIINTKVSGVPLFNNPTYPTTTNATVTGYVHSCWEKHGPATEFTKVTDYTPSIPEY